MEYNGWTNYQTWCFKLWLDNDLNLYNEFYNYIVQNIDDARVLRLTCNYLKDIADELTEEHYENEACFGQDLIGYALNEIDYTQIATSFIDDIRKEQQIEEN